MWRKRAAVAVLIAAAAIAGCRSDSSPQSARPALTSSDGVADEATAFRNLGKRAESAF